MHQHLPRDKHHGTRHQRSVVVSGSGYLVLMGCSARMQVSSCSIAVKPHGIAACDEGGAMVRQAAAAAMNTQQTGVARAAQAADGEPTEHVKRLLKAADQA